MTDVAIVGMGCLFPGAPDLAAFAANLRAGVDAIGEAPAARWDPAFAEIYTRRGGFVDEHAWFDPVAHGVDRAGPAWTVDAACASALVAVEQGVPALRSRRLDVVLAGGAHFCQDEAFWTVFAELGALSRAGSIRPFDRRADGLLIGE